MVGVQLLLEVWLQILPYIISFWYNILLSFLFQVLPQTLVFTYNTNQHHSSIAACAINVSVQTSLRLYYTANRLCVCVLPGEVWDAAASACLVQGPTHPRHQAQWPVGGQRRCEQHASSQCRGQHWPSGKPGCSTRYRRKPCRRFAAEKCYGVSSWLYFIEFCT